MKVKVRLVMNRARCLATWSLHTGVSPQWVPDFTRTEEFVGQPRFWIMAM